MPFLLERMIDGQTMFIQTGVCGRLLSKVSPSFQGKAAVVVVADDKISAFNFGKLVSATVSFHNLL